MANYTLTHPLYLDEPMMISFLAHLEGGVAFEGEETVRSGSAGEVKGEGGAKFKFPLIGALLGAEANIAAAGLKKAEQSSEYKAAKHHTAASLFNALYAYLRDDDQIVSLDHPDQLTSIQPRQLVEIHGRYMGNPLEEVLAMLSQILTYMDLEEKQEAESEPKPIPPAKAKRSGNPSVRNQAAQVVTQEETERLAQEVEEKTQRDFGTRVLLQMREDIKDVPVHDVVVHTPDGLQAVLTVLSEYFSPSINEYLRAGDFVVLGKVTRILRDDESINLTRRTVMGAAGPDVARNIVKQVTESPDLYVDGVDPIVSAPAVQILPMAIFV